MLFINVNSPLAPQLASIAFAEIKKTVTQYTMLLITLNAMHVASSAITFFTYHRPLEVFFRQVSLAGIFFLVGGGGGIVTPPPVISNGPSLSNS